MAESSNPETGRRFASDLRQIREERGITAEALHDETKIPMGLIQSFEQTGLFDHPMFNRVYLRSFVRTYSQAIGIPQDSALASLDEALEGTYQGSLAGAFLSPRAQPAEPPVDTLPEAEMPTTSEESSAAATVYHEPESTEHHEPGDAEPEVSPHEEEPSVTSEAPQEPLPPPVVAPVEAEPVVEREMAPDRPAARRVPADREPDEERANKGWMYVFAGVVSVAVIGFLLFSTIGTPSGNLAAVGADGESEAVAAPDTSAAAAAPTPPVVLGDTMNVTIVAANAPVQNIKVTVDDDLRRPYWIEHSESRTFMPTQRIVIERQLPKIQLQVEGRPYPTNRTDELGRIVITRDSVQQLLSRAQ